MIHPTMGDVLVGAVLDQGGALQQDNLSIRNGLEFCVSEINANGGLGVGSSRRNLSLTILDGNFQNITAPVVITPEEASSGLPGTVLLNSQAYEQKYQQLVDNGSFAAVFGPFSSTYTTFAASQVNGSLPFFATAASASTLYNASLESFYGVLPRTQLFVSSSDVFPILYRAGARRFGITFEQSDLFSREAAEASRLSIQQAGGDVVIYQTFADDLAPGASAFNPLTNTVLEYMAITPPLDVFVLTGIADLYPVTRSIFFTQEPEFKAAVFVGPIETGDAREGESQGWINTNIWAPDIPNEPGTTGLPIQDISAFESPSQYSEAYFSVYNQVPGENEAIGSAACMLYGVAVETAGSVEQSDIDAVMPDLDFQNFFGGNRLEQGPEFFNDNAGKSTATIQFQATGPPVYINPDESRLVYPTRWPWTPPENQLSNKDLALIISLSVVSIVIVLIFVGLLFYYRRKRQKRYNRAHFGKRSKIIPQEGEDAVAVVTDIEASTPLFESNPAAMGAASKLHNDTIRKLIKKNYGFEVRTEGDSFTVVFHAAVDALLFSMDLQQQLLKAPWPAILAKVELTGGYCPTSTAIEDEVTIFRGLRVRVGIHSGKMRDVEMIAKQICDVVRSGGETVVSEKAWREAAGLFRSDDIISDGSAAERFFNYIWDRGGAGVSAVRRIPQNSSIFVCGSKEAVDEDARTSTVVAHTESHKMHQQQKKRVVMGDKDAEEEIYCEHLGDIRIRNISDGIGDGIPLLSVLPDSLRARAQFFEDLKAIQLTPPFRSAPCAGLYPSPQFLQPVTIVFMTCYGMASLLQHDRTLGERTMRLLETDAVDVCCRDEGGYKCEAFDIGFLLAFPEAANAINFAINIHRTALHLKWEDELIERDEFGAMFVRLSEESLEARGKTTDMLPNRSSTVGDTPSSLSQGTTMSQASILEMSETSSPRSDSGLEQPPPEFGADTLKMVMRGPRLKIGLYEDIPLEVMPHATTGRAMYTGNLINRCARIQSKCPPGHVLSDIATWESAQKPEALSTAREEDEAAELARLKSIETIGSTRCTSLGYFHLKGVKEKMRLVHIWDPDLLIYRPLPILS